MIRKIALVSLLAAFAAFACTTPSSAKTAEKGSAFLSFQLTEGDADLITPEPFSSGGLGGSVAAYDHSEWGGQIMYQYLLSDEWAVAPSFGVGTFKETDKPGTNATPGDPDFVYKQSSWNVRLGLDRFVNVGDRFVIFVGPGISAWSGKAKFTESSVVESESTSRIALDARIGAHVAIGDSFGMSWQIGHYIGHASGEEAGAKATWTPSGNEGAFGASFHF